jgi:predicted MPP superfamily phosphohydrolase
MAAIGAEAVLLEPNQPRLQRVDIPLARLPEALDGFTIAQISDLHYDDVFSIHPIRKSVEIINRLHPDLVVLTGDFVTIPEFAEYLHDEKKSADAAEPCARILAHLRSRFGAIVALGNHDVKADPDRIARIFTAQSMPVLRNAALPLERDGARLWIAGLDSVTEGKPDPEQALKSVPRNEPVVMLVHEPDYADKVVRYPVDLQLSGHSHGGQIRLPLIGPPYLPEMARKYPWGLYRVGRLTLYTNVGIGTIRLPIRWNCSPEITLFTLRAARG